MARTVRDAKLETRTARDELKVSGKPHFKSIDSGLHLGYRKGKRGGKWVIRWYEGDGKYKVETIGLADDTQDADNVSIFNFSQAQAKARELFLQWGRQSHGLEAVPEGPYTVKNAIDDYLTDYDRRSGKSRSPMEASINAHIIPPMGTLEVAKLTQNKIKSWHEKISKTPARLRTREGEDQQYRGALESPDAIRKRRSTANKILTMLKSALNYSYHEGKVASNAAWVNVKPFKDVDAPTIRYLNDKESTRLVNACPSDLRAMVTAALLTGARYGELTRLITSDFNPNSGTLYVSISKSGKDRHIALTDEGKVFFNRATAGKLGSDLIFRRTSGTPLGRAQQYRPLKDACKVAKIEPAIGFHILRHTYGSRLANRSVPMAVIAAQLGHADTRITEKHYAHLGPSYVADTVRNAFGEIGLLEDDNVVSINNV